MVEPVSPAKTRVLIADDEDVVAEVLQDALRLARYEVRRSRDGQEAMDDLKKFQPDIVLLDIQMPRLDGLEVCRRIKADVFYRHVPVLMLTAQGGTRSKVSGLDCGADDYVTKPFDMDELLARMRTLLRRTRQGLEANPLTRLPGNVTLEKEIMQRLKAQTPLAVLYIDLNEFKAYNDTYGFVKGDEVILETARLVVTASDGCGGFVGHIGGDDFVVLTTPDRCEKLCQDIVAAFDAKAGEFYNAEDRARGFITTKNRRGEMTTFPLLSLAIGVVTNQWRVITSLGEVSKIGAEMKHFAKEHRAVEGEPPPCETRPQDGRPGRELGSNRSAYAIDRRKE